MRIRRSVFMMLVFLMTCGLSHSVWATVANLQSFKQAYPGLEAKLYSCKVCHVSPIGKKGDLNLYGMALQKLKLPADAKKLAVEDYSLIDPEDADNDGVSNLDEIKAGTSPGDPVSTPPKNEVSVPENVKSEPAVQNDQVVPAKEKEEQKKENSSSNRSRTLEHLLARLAEGVIPTVSAEEVAQAKPEYVGTETCASCHAEIAKQHQHSAHNRVGADGPDGLDISCESCHGAGSLHVEAGGGRGVGGITKPSKDPAACYSCHTDKKMEFALQYHHPVPEGRMSCADCHSAHGEKPTPRSTRDQNELCLKCHQQIKGPWVFEHLAMRDGCLTCHAPHGSITTRLLTERDFNLCLKCHFSASQYQRLGHYAHRRAYNPSAMAGANCTGCHRSVHGSNFSKELRTQ